VTLKRIYRNIRLVEIIKIFPQILKELRECWSLIKPSHLKRQLTEKEKERLRATLEQGKLPSQTILSLSPTIKVRIIKHTHTPIHPYTHTPIHPYTHTPTHTHTPIHPYTHTHAHTHSSSREKISTKYYP
jgi:hypothetical protein